jgi:predicted DNA-binding transcriptional regulator AlpA
MSDLAHRRLRTPAAADYLGYSESTLEKKRLTGDGPPFIRLGRVIVYDTRDLDQFLVARRATNTSDRPAASGAINDSKAPVGQRLDGGDRVAE